jgi:hypothetical protein
MIIEKKYFLLFGPFEKSRKNKKNKNGFNGTTLFYYSKKILNLF